MKKNVFINGLLALTALVLILPEEICKLAMNLEATLHIYVKCTEQEQLEIMTMAVEI